MPYKAYKRKSNKIKERQGKSSRSQKRKQINFSWCDVPIPHHVKKFKSHIKEIQI